MCAVRAIHTVGCVNSLSLTLEGDALMQLSVGRLRPAAGLLAVVGLFASVALASSPALAVCKDGPPCVRETPEPTPTPTPNPSVTTIKSVSPTFAWSGDTIKLTGTGFTGATVTINGLNATITTPGSTSMSVVVPQIFGPSGPFSVPVVVSSPTGTAQTSFQLSPTLQLSHSATYGVNAEFGQGMDGNARATATLDRSSGFTQSKLIVTNTQTWASLSVNMSVVWLNDAGVVVGYTDPDNVTASGVVFRWPSDISTAEASSRTPWDPTRASRRRSVPRGSSSSATTVPSCGARSATRSAPRRRSARCCRSSRPSSPDDHGRIAPPR